MNLFCDNSAGTKTNETEQVKELLKQTAFHMFIQLINDR